MPKLNYKIVGRRMPTAEGGSNVIPEFEYVDVEWRHEDGFPPDTITVPVTHPPEIRYETRTVGKREVLKDQITVKRGTPDSIVAMMLEERRPGIARSLNIEP